MLLVVGEVLVLLPIRIQGQMVVHGVNILLVEVGLEVLLPVQELRVLIEVLAVEMVEVEEVLETLVVLVALEGNLAVEEVAGVLEMVTQDKVELAVEVK